MKVVSYLGVVPEKNKSFEKTELLKLFIQGVNASGDTGVVYTGNTVQDSQVAVIQGWQHQRGKSAGHLALRQKIIETQQQQKKYVISADSNLFLYFTKNNEPHHYLRYGINGVFPDTAIYCDDNPNPARWQQISKDLDITIGKYRKKGRNILFCLQRNGGWSMGETDLLDWIESTVAKVRQHSDRHIILRPHPGDKKSQEYLVKNQKRLNRLTSVSISPSGRNFAEDLNKTWAVVNHNSSSIVGPVIQGYHAFITDPAKSQCAEVTHHDFSHIENPQQFDREKWLQRISMFHWNFHELQNGSAWKHMRNYCQ